MTSKLLSYTESRTYTFCVLFDNGKKFLSNITSDRVKAGHYVYKVEFIDTEKELSTFYSTIIYSDELYSKRDLLSRVERTLTDFLYKEDLENVAGASLEED